MTIIYHIFIQKVEQLMNIKMNIPSATIETAAGQMARPRTPAPTALTIEFWD
jgi:hypothetical protein